MGYSRIPAQGERNAIIGYYPQYRIGAALVIRGLRDGDLRWIALADPQMGRVDDFQVGTEERVDAYQIKWSQFSETITFNDLVKEADGVPSLIAQLADGWQRLNAQNPDRRNVVHLVTNRFPSVSDQPPNGKPAPSPRHFAAFFEQAWKPAHQSVSTAEAIIPTVWQTAWSVLEKASCLIKEEFKSFVRDCELEFAYPLPSTAELNGWDADIYLRDLDHATYTIFAAVFDPQRIVRFSRDELLSRLGWRSRVEFRNRHSFTVDENLYQPIEESKDELEQALSDIESGYVAVLGGPGSGKSSLLTQTLRYFVARVIRYYAFVPDAHGAALRGESVNFLHDIVRAIDEAGFPSGRSLNQLDREQLRERLYDQFRLLHEDWRRTGRKTIILVDGLDHIPREQHPAHSLMRDLPPPDQVPQGVIFVLGSQTDQLDDLSPSLQLSIRQPERRVEMKPLSRKAVNRIIENSGLANLLLAEQKDRVFQLSAGHPLALVYLLKQLRAAVDADALTSILSDASPYDGDIEAQYHGHWRQFEKDHELVHLLGLIARMRGVIDLRWAESLASAQAIHRLHQEFTYLFRIEDHNRWYFFHNSFRLFLAARTAESRPAVFDPDKDHALHRELAEKCQQGEDLRWKWEELYHLSQAGADEELLERAKPRLLREQFLNFRPAEAIRADIDLAIRAAGRKYDVVALTRLLLCDAEIAQRASLTEEIPLASLLLSLNEQRAALEQLRDGQRLLVAPEKGLSAAAELLNLGLEAEAQQVFDLSEPLEFLSGTAEIDRYNYKIGEHPIDVWASTAIYFRPTAKVIAAIRRIRVKPNRSAVQTEDGDQAAIDEEATAASRRIQNRLLYNVGVALIKENRWDELNEVEQALSDVALGNKNWWFWLRATWWEKSFCDGDLAGARRVLTDTLLRAASADLNDAQRVLIAEAHYRVLADEDQTKAWLEGVELPIMIRSQSFGLSFSDFEQLFCHARLLYALGDNRIPAQMIPDAPETRGQGVAYFQRGVCVVAQLWAQSWRGQRVDQATISQETFPLLRLFNHSWRDTDWDAWLSLSNSKADFYEALIEAIARHDTEYVRELAESFAQEWRNHRRFWPTESVRKVIVALWRAGVSSAWAAEQLEWVDEIIEHDELPSRITEKAAQAGAYLKLGRTDRAKSVLLHALLEASSVASKDFQLNQWIKWLQRVNEFEPELAAGRVGWFARAVVELERNGGQSSDAAYDLLEAAFAWSPCCAVRLFHWFLGRGLIHFDNGARRLLRAGLGNAGPPTELIGVILTDFLLPVCDDDPPLATLLINALNQRSGKAKTIEVAKELVTKVEIHSLPSNRHGWRHGLAKALLKNGLPLLEVGLSEDDLKTENNGSTDHGLRLKDGSTLSTAEVRGRVTSLASLRELMRRAEDSYFHWDGIIRDLIPSLTEPADVKDVAMLFNNSSLTLSKLAEQLLSLGDVQGARLLAQRALALSESSGWAVHLSGGTRTAAFKVLTAIDGEKAHQQAIETLTQDASGEFRYPGSTIQYLDEILPVLTPNVPVREVWAEIEQYLYSLFPAASDIPIDNELAAAINLVESDDTPARAFADWLSSFIAHPIYVLAHSAQRVFIRLLLQDEGTIQAAVHKLLQGSEGEQESVLAVLDAVSLQNTDAVMEFEADLQGLSHSPNFALRLTAQLICQRVGIHLTVKKIENLITPSLYRLSLPSGRSAEEVWNESQISDADFLAGADDPYDLLKASLLELEFVASEARLPKENVIQRAAQIAGELLQADTWASRGEEVMRSQLQSAGLKYTYRRPRATIARRASYHVIAELVDIGRLNDQNLKNLAPVCIYCDPQMMLISPVARPAFVPPMSGGQQEIGSPMLAIGHNETNRLNLWASDDLVILGELTEMKRLEWEVPTVIRQSVVSASKPPADDPESFFYRKIHRLVGQYPLMKIEASPPPLVIHYEGLRSDFQSLRWLAFNPELARELGWSSKSDELFGWEDENGNLMVHSVWWQDGLLQTPPPKFHDEVGEGWVVLATTEALERVQEHIGLPLIQYLRIEQESVKRKKPGTYKVIEDSRAFRIGLEG